MWSDSLLLAERALIVRLLLWSASSVLAGTVVLVVLGARRVRSVFLEQFSAQLIAWGALVLLAATMAWRSVALRDLAGATRLQNGVWLAGGLAVGCIAVGITLVAIAWRQRPGLVGAGIGVLTQGAAFLVLSAHFLTVLVRLALRIDG